MLFPIQHPDIYSCMQADIVLGTVISNSLNGDFVLRMQDIGVNNKVWSGTATT